jgi:predicted dienelactone hydrolase
VLLDRGAAAARHFALRVYPPLNLGPTAEFGPSPVGVRTLEVVDQSRQNPAGTGPRALTVEVYYPSTPDAVAGVPRDIVQVFGLELFPTPTYRDVARDAGPFPLIVYSHGSGGNPLRESGALRAPRQPWLRGGERGSSWRHAARSRRRHDRGAQQPPRDVSFLIDTFVDFNVEAGNFFAGAIDPTRIGASGWSYGGYTVLALAAGSFSLGTFTDPRVRAIMPLDGSAQVFDPDVPALYPTITIPTLLLGASLSDVIAPRLQQLFDGLPSGPGVVAYGNFLDAVHPSFADQCEVPEVLRGESPACEPPAVPWRHVRHIENYLALNFFDASLKGDTSAEVRLRPDVLADVEELSYQRK